MEISKITEEWLKSQKFEIKKDLTIDGVFMKDLVVHLDDRGDVIELWSTYWEEYKNGIIGDCKHAYQSATDPGIVKGWHLHEKHTDQFTVTRGKLQICMIDIREKSSTFGNANSIVMGTAKPRFLKIPPGILHGWKTLGNTEAIVVNFQSHCYDPNDEFKFPWDIVLSHIWGPRNG